DSNIAEVNAAKADTPGFDIREVTKKLHDNGIMVIARMVTFKDSTMTKYSPELAIKTETGDVFKQKDSGGYSMWLDASNPKAWEYIASVAKEAVQFGFDEIQFDYIRFPETTLYKYQINLQSGEERHNAIEGFIRYVRNALPPDTILSADIFGMPLIASKDYGQIGQTLETIGMSLDSVNPMIYPSHFANNAQKGAMSNKVGQTINGINFTHPDLKPYEVVYNTLLVGKNRIDKKEGYNLNMRPYIQGFTASYLPSGYWMKYGVDQYRAQIKAVYDAGYKEWIFWNSPNDYVEAAFLPE
ncbi:MAG: putative glycoside hydrolase, partial [Clostridia bacterium]|nr:putative glycoside hydrolase [Clostridia bacterium]